MTSPTKITRVCVLTSALTDDSAFHNVDDIECSPALFFKDVDCKYTFNIEYLRKESSYAVLRGIVTSGKYDVYFNLCDGAADEDRAGEDVVRALEQLNVPFTGSDSKHYDITKPDMKFIAYYGNIAVPMYYVMNKMISKEELAERVADLRFPVIVKHPQGYGSIDMTPDSKCMDIDHLYQRAVTFFNIHHRVLIEEYITGDEATVLAVEAPNNQIEVLNPVLMNFPAGEEFKHFNLKWVDMDGMEWKSMSEDDPARDESMRVAREAFRLILGGIGSGRADLRIDRTNNKVYLLEVNANCGMFYPPGSEGSADWIMKLDKRLNHADVITMMIESAISRHASRQVNYEVHFEPKKGYHVIAARDIRDGTAVFADEGKAMPIVTKPFVDATWNASDKQLFAQYAWPLSADKHVYAIWQDDYTTWRPINHSCDPNLVFAAPHSLNVVARRDISAGTELTMDYSTFCDETMQPFDCKCGSEKCRKMIVMTSDSHHVYGPHSWKRHPATTSTTLK